VGRNRWLENHPDNASGLDNGTAHSILPAL
jgi:hypothetical protein